MSITLALMLLVQMEEMEPGEGLEPFDPTEEAATPIDAEPDPVEPLEPVAPWSQPGEEGVEPYEISNENAGTRPFEGTAMLEAFHGREGIRRISDRTIELSLEDERIGEIFRPFDMPRLRRTLFEHFCYILNGGCDYTGRDMVAAHRDMGVERADMNALVENLQQAMREEGVSFRRQKPFPIEARADAARDCGALSTCNNSLVDQPANFTGRHPKHFRQTSSLSAPSALAGVGGCRS